MYTIDSLIKHLAELKVVYGGDTEIWLYSDPEGNKFSGLEYLDGSSMFVSEHDVSEHDGGASLIASEDIDEYDSEDIRKVIVLWP